MDDKLLYKYIEGVASEDEIKEVVDWLDKSEDNVAYYINCHKLYDTVIMNSIDEEHKTKRFSIKRISIEIAKIAAVALVFFCVDFFLSKPKTESQPVLLTQTVSVPAGQHIELILPDSTKVWVNACSKIVYPTTFASDNRIVELEGEAFFDVSKNKDLPFIVKTQNADVKVLGTEFNVLSSSESNSLYVSLIEGSVELNSKYLSDSYIMKPGEMMKLEDGEFTVSRIKDMDYFEWRNGVMCFKNVKIGDMLERLASQFGVNMIYQRKDILQESYTGKFYVSDGIEQVLRILQLEHKFSYSRTNNEIIIK